MITLKIVTNFLTTLMGILTITLKIDTVRLCNLKMFRMILMKIFKNKKVNRIKEFSKVQNGLLDYITVMNTLVGI